MAATGLLALLDDITLFLDDVALLTKVATKKTAGVLGDDLALNAQQVTGVKADRELPVVWAVAKGSLLNKLILVPSALLLSLFAPWSIKYLLMIGGAFLCYEGFEKLVHKLLHRQEAEQHAKDLLRAVEDGSVDMLQFERDKIRGAIRTDFILSAEIIVIALGTMQDVDFGLRVAALSTIALLVTVIIYGVVAAIVKLDDAGLHMIGKGGDRFSDRAQRAFGRGLLAFCPWLMKTLSILGTAAMFLVGGGILLHGLPGLHELIHHIEHWVSFMPGWLQSTLWNAVCGLVAGALLVLVVELGSKFKPASPAT